MNRLSAGRFAVLCCCVTLLARPVAAGADPVVTAQAYGRARPAVLPQADGTIVAEGEEFQVQSPGWKARPWGENYYAATLANTFLSRKAFLGAPESGPESVAIIQVAVAEPGKYLVLARYEAAYRFETQFRIQIEQAGRVVFDRLYGARDNLKIWAFGQKLQKEVGWDWGAVENVVWEGHDAAADLQAGPAKISLLAADQPAPQARRNVDLVMLTKDHDQVKMRIEKESYLPLDGMLTQEGDVWLKVHNMGGTPITVREGQFPNGPCQQHSPYWVHLRNWKPLALEVAAGGTSDWTEVGRLLDTLNDGQWGFRIDGQTPRCKLEFGVRAPDGKIEPVGQFEASTATIDLAFHADTRYVRQVRDPRQVLTDLMTFLKAQPAAGKTPRRTLIYGYTFDPREDAPYTALRREFIQMFALAPTTDEPAGGGMPRGYIDVRGVPDDKLDEYCAKLGDRAGSIASVSLGDEIGLPAPGGDVQGQFRAYLQTQGLKPSDVVPAAGADWSQVLYKPDAAAKSAEPRLFYWSNRFLYHYGIQEIKKRTDVLRRRLPNAGVGANFSPHHGGATHAYLGEVFKWVTCFREDGMTMPWSEDYIWQVPVGTPQMNNINLDLFRAGVRGKPNAKIQFYVMPHWPGNNPAMWRRLFYGALGHGMKIVNLFEFRPVQAAYTENHVTYDPMYSTVLRSFRELGTFEDIVQDGQVRPAEVGLWFSETADIWSDNAGSFAAAKRGLYTAIIHQQTPLDVVVEQDALDGTLNSYKALYLTDNHVSRAASARIAAWVERGGVLLATAGAGMWDENNEPNAALRSLLGVDQTALDAPADAAVRYIKQDLPFAAAIDKVTMNLTNRPAELPVFAVRSRVRLTGAEPLGKFQDGSAAVTVRKVGQGRAIYCAFLPALSYYKPAIPLRPVDRSSADDAMCHLLPTAFDRTAAFVVGLAAAHVARPAACSEPLVETTVIESKHGVVMPLVNWSGRPVKSLNVTVSLATPTAQVSLASGAAVQVTKEANKTVVTFDLDIADALILR
jgi:hypothetical protein